MVNRRAFIAGSAALLSACGGSVTTAPLVAGEGDDNFGAIEDPAEFAAVTQVLPPAALVTSAEALVSPGSSFVLPNLPTISAQGVGGHYGSPGTCEAQSFGYGLGSYTAAQQSPGVFKWTPETSENLISAAWLFAWSMSKNYSTCPKGGQAIPYLKLLVESGAPSVADVPYNPNGYTSAAEMCTYFSNIPVSTTYPDESRFVIGGYNALPPITPDKQPAVLPMIKALVASGSAVAFSGLVAPGYGVTSPVLVNDVFYLNGTAKGGHGQLIVGYNDSLGSTSDPGAFLVQNSFGEGWNPGDPSDPGRNGRIWYSYTSWFATQHLAATATPLAPAVPAGVALSAGQSGAPLVEIVSAHDWNDAANDRHALVLGHSFGSPLRLQHLSVTDPTGATFDQDHGGSSRNGYTYVYRTDGNPFPNGKYTIRLTVQTVAGQTLVYSGTIPVPLTSA
jgi:hypothetical protein